MDSDSWANRLFSGSRKYQSKSYLYYGEEDEMDGEDDSRPEFLCPFCADEFDVVELCCHIDEEHAIEAQNGVCPVCEKRAGMDLVGHITTQHGNLLKVQRKKRLCKGGNNLAFSKLKKELREGSLQSFLGGFQSLESSNSEPDPLLSSFMSNLPTIDEPVKEIAFSSDEESLVNEFSALEPFERNEQRSPISVKDQEERARRSEFVQGLFLSSFMDEIL